MSAPGSARVSKFAVHLLAIVLVIMMAQSLARLTWLPFRDWQPAVSGTAAMQAPERQSDRIPALVTGNLFGRQESQAAQQVLSQIEAPKTRLQLILEGVFLAEKEEDSGAIVSERGQSAQRYRIGEKLPGNAELVGVFPDRIVLRRAGQLEALSFEDATAASGMVEKVERPQVSSPEEFVSLAQRQLTENPVAALASVGLAPADTSGQPQGYVYNGNNPMLRALNLQQGDIIRSVNGHVLGDMQKDREMLKELSQQAMLEVEVERGGVSFTVSYPLR